MFVNVTEDEGTKNENVRGGLPGALATLFPLSSPLWIYMIYPRPKTYTDRFRGYCRRYYLSDTCGNTDIRCMILAPRKYCVVFVCPRPAPQISMLASMCWGTPARKKLSTQPESTLKFGGQGGRGRVCTECTITLLEFVRRFGNIFSKAQVSLK